MLDMIAESYRNIEAFYTRFPAARRSPESDYGVWWKCPDGKNWRVTYVHATGHVYAIQLGGTTSFFDSGLDATVIMAGDKGPNEGPVVILGKIEPFPEEEEDRVRRSNRFRVAPPPIEGIIDGWAEKCGEQGSLEWIYDRIQSRTAR